MNNQVTEHLLAASEIKEQDLYDTLALIHAHDNDFADLYFQSSQQADDNVPPIAFVIYGPDVGIFFKENYSEYKPIVDLAARLSALEVIEVKVCQVSYESEGLDSSTLLPFVSTVPFGPAEVNRLLVEQEYSFF